MQIALVGADHEENLGLGMIAAAAEAAAHQVSVLPFSEVEQLANVVDRIVETAPAVVGLSIQFQHRAHEFLHLVRCLRARGYAGHVTCGGQFPTMAYRELLASRSGVDTVVLHDGEETFVELLEGLDRGAALGDVAGLAFVGDDGAVVRSAGRCLAADLDRLPLPRRYRAHSQHLGVPFIPIMGSRGCWGACSFCSITTYYRDARRHGGGRMLRHRSPENIAAEMAALCNRAGGRAIFCFHDDSFLLPRPEASAARVRAIRRAFDAYGMGRIGIVGKCRPDSLTRELARELADLGLFRLYVGVENVSEAGSRHLGRRVRTGQVREALAACREVGIFGCYNLLLFEPDAALADVEENLAFIREHADHPVNFCRAEPYCGTPLQQRLAAASALSGSYLGYDYRIADDQVELLFRVCAAAFRERNFASAGVHNRYMGLGYNAAILSRFHDDPGGERAALCQEAARLTRAIALETADFLEEAIRLVREVGAGQRERLERETARLGLRIAAADRCQHARLDEVLAALSDFARRNGQPAARPRPVSAIVRVGQRMAQGVALSTLLAGWGVGVQACDDGRTVAVDGGTDSRPDATVVDPLPPDGAVEDPLPPDFGVVDPPPPDATVVDPPPPDATVDLPLPVDPLPPDATVVDPPPPDATVDLPLPVDPLPPDASASLRLPGPHDDRVARVASYWRDTSPRRVVRSADLPFHDPPEARLLAVATERGVRVRLAVRPDQVTTRWESDGRIEGDGLEVLWTPESKSDQLRVGVRWRGGVAIATLRARDFV